MVRVGHSLAKNFSCYLQSQTAAKPHTTHASSKIHPPHKSACGAFGAMKSTGYLFSLFCIVAMVYQLEARRLRDPNIARGSLSQGGGDKEERELSRAGADCYCRCLWMCLQCSKRCVCGPHPRYCFRGKTKKDGKPSKAPNSSIVPKAPVIG